MNRESGVATQYAVGVPNRMISTIATAFVSAVTMSASFAALVPSAATRSPGGTRRKIADDRQQQEEQGDARREDDRRPEHLVYDGALGSGRKPAFLNAVCPLAERIRLIQARAAALFRTGTTAIS